ncbi:hypothetical protein BBJ28_00023524 [Nothophytophthora sp. Chile5]|nr:hypothetical protein BBJ28_00023524 [Nothophytophthora sp. Chile5]
MTVARRHTWGAELREAIESCMVQWQRIQWPEELNSMFVAPTCLILSGSAAIKSEAVQSPTAAGEEDAELELRFDVMDELKRVMIDLTQDQIVPPPKRIKPTTLVV